VNRLIKLEIAYMRIRERWYRKQEKAQEQKKVRKGPTGFPLPNRR
jgi:hypothetical protein